MLPAARCWPPNGSTNTPAQSQGIGCANPNIIKPSCHMPNLQLSGEDLTALTAYLETLK